MAQNMSETLNTLIEELRHPDLNVRSQAALSLGKRGGTDALDALLQALGSEADTLVREDITWALVRMGEAALAPLITLLDDPNPAVRHNATHVLGKIGDVRAVEVLIHVLQDTDITVLLKAAFALGQIGDVRAIPALMQLVGHEEHEVEASVGQVLASFGEAAVPALIEATHHERWQVREQAADILGMIGGEQTVPALVAALADDDWQVRFSAVTALGYVGGVSAKAAVESMRDDRDSRVRSLTSTVMKRVKV